jgi:hypothetical protein
MVPFSPGNPPAAYRQDYVQRLQDVARLSFLLCVSAGELALAIAAIFSTTDKGTTTVTLGTTAPTAIANFSTTPSKWKTIVDPDGTVNVFPVWRIR